jgi:hypothetical protein
VIARSFRLCCCNWMVKASDALQPSTRAAGPRDCISQCLEPRQFQAKYTH